jgi:RNA polymerase sigma-70 factor (ECF subfamily)
LLAGRLRLDYYESRCQEYIFYVVTTVKYIAANTSNETTSHTQLSVVRGAQANDAGAWEALVRAYSRRIYRWCRLKGLQAADSANVVQEVLQSIAVKIGDFRRDHEGHSFRAWIRRITENKIHDHFRRENRQLAHASGGTDAYVLLSNHAGADDQAMELVTSTSVRDHERYSTACNQVRDEISERDWRLFWRIVVDGQPAGEAAAECGISANAARLVKMRVLRRFRQLLTEQSNASSKISDPCSS